VGVRTAAGVADAELGDSVVVGERPNQNVIAKVRNEDLEEGAGSGAFVHFGRPGSGRA